MSKSFLLKQAFYRAQPHNKKVPGSKTFVAFRGASIFSGYTSFLPAIRVDIYKYIKYKVITLQMSLFKGVHVYITCYRGNILVAYESAWLCYYMVTLSRVRIRNIWLS